MQFILGLLTAVVFFICLATAFYIGRVSAKKKSETKPIDKEEQRKRERINKHFQNLFNYDIETAYSRKKVE